MSENNDTLGCFLTLLLGATGFAVSLFLGAWMALVNIRLAITFCDVWTHIFQWWGSVLSKKLVYVAGPYTHGGTAQNVRRALDVADALADAGFLPYVPHLSHFWHLLHPRPYEFWTELDMAYLEKCDFVVRLPGHSPGADAEVKRAKEISIPVIELQKDFNPPNILAALIKEGLF